MRFPAASVRQVFRMESVAYYEETRLSAQGREPVVRPDHSRNGRVESLDAQDETHGRGSVARTSRDSRAEATGCMKEWPATATVMKRVTQSAGARKHSHGAEERTRITLCCRQSRNPMHHCISLCLATCWGYVKSGFRV